jgi:hypothetical protein
MSGLCGPNDDQLQRNWRKLRFNQFRSLYISPTTFNKIRWRQLLVMYLYYTGKSLQKSSCYESYASRSQVMIKTKDNIEMYLKKEVLRKLLWAKHNLIYLQTQFVTHSKRVPSRLYKPISYRCFAEVTLFPESHTSR